MLLLCATVAVAVCAGLAAVVPWLVTFVATGAVVLVVVVVC